MKSLQEKLTNAEYWLNECQIQYDNYDKKFLKSSCLPERLKNRKSKVLEIKKQIEEEKIINQKKKNDLLFGESLI